MKKIILAGFLAITLVSAANASEKAATSGSIKNGDTKAAHAILDKKCTKCHSGKIIDAALKDKKDMFKIQQEMEKRGAKLNSKEREVLGIFWKEQNPLKPPQ